MQQHNIIKYQQLYMAMYDPTAYSFPSPIASGSRRTGTSRAHASAAGAAGRQASISRRSETTPQSVPPAVIHTWPMLMKEKSEWISSRPVSAESCSAQRL